MVLPLSSTDYIHLTLPLRLPKPHFHRLSRLHHNIRFDKLLPLPILFHALEPLQYPHHRIPHLGERKLLPDADPRAPVERNVFPRFGLPVLPSVRAEEEGIREGGRGWRVEIEAALHYYWRVADWGVLADTDGFEAGGTAAVGEGGVVEGEADVEGDTWVEAENFVQAMLQVAHVFEIGVGWRFGGPKVVEDLMAEFGDDVRVGRELVEEPGKGAGGGVAACEEAGDELVPKLFAIAREGGDGVQKGVTCV